MADDALREAAERFARDTADHQVTVLHDRGLYRHVRFQQPGTSFYWFDVVTWPGVLTIRGDMGTYVFARTEDMVGFFRQAHVNPGYWAEKVVDGQERVRAFSGARARQIAREVADSHTEEWSEVDRDRLNAALTDMFEQDEFASHDGAHFLLRDFMFPRQGDDPRWPFFSDTWEWDLREFTVHYLWCCHAVRHAVAALDTLAQETVDG